MLWWTRRRRLDSNAFLLRVRRWPASRSSFRRIAGVHLRAGNAWRYGGTAFADDNCDCYLAGIGAHESDVGRRQAIGKQFGRGYVDRIERTDRMGCDALMPAQELQHLAASFLVDIALDERARIQVQPTS